MRSADSTAAVVAIRLWFGLFSIASAAYLLLVYVPFTHFLIHRGGMIGSITVGLRWYPAVYWVTVLLNAWTLRPSISGRGSGAILAALLALQLVTGCALTVFYPLPSLSMDEGALWLGVALLVPLILTGITDWRQYATGVPWSTEPASPSRAYGTALAAAVWLWLLFTGSGLLRSGGGERTLGEALGIGLWSLAAHMVVFLALFCVVAFARGLGRLSRQPEKIGLLIFVLVAAAFFRFLLQRFIFHPLAIGGAWREVYALAVVTAAGAWYAGLCARIARGSRMASPSAILLAPFRFGDDQGRARGAILILAGSAAGLALVAWRRETDWNSTIQVLAVSVCWAIVLLGFHSVMRGRRASAWRQEILLATVIPVLAMNVCMERWGPGIWSRTFGVDLAVSLEEFKLLDPSLLIAHGVMTPLRDNTGFYRYLERNTNLPVSFHVEAKPIRLASREPGSGTVRPHVFIIVVDCLRRDYLSPYNSAVTFTPEIDRFARESDVIGNAITRYVGTNLSVASLWAGSLIPHKHFVSPFAPLNSLEQLMERENYRTVVTWDGVMRGILAPSGRRQPLDLGVHSDNIRLGKTMAQVQTILRAPAGRDPWFLYTQPQDLHPLTSSEPRLATIPRGFNRRYASVLSRVDADFGRFLQLLRETELYQDSVIILTSDHGESLGEHNRSLHGGLFPELIRIPLIIRIPEALRKALQRDPLRMVFLNDITPTLYYLLGYRPVDSNELFGRPIFTLTPGEQRRYDKPVVLIHSYQSLYGTLDPTGRTLYVADAVLRRDFVMDFRHPDPPRLPAPPATRAAARQAIREQIEAINRYFGIKPQ